MDENDLKFVERAYELARKSFEEGGLPIGSVLVRAGQIIGEGHNRRVQHGDAIAHGEMDCIRNAGRQRTYKDTVLYTSLSPCLMCSGTIVQFGIPRVVIGENTTFGGNESFLQGRGVTVEIANDKKCIELMQRFIREHPETWNEDIGED
jgi:cytosine/creatinine deaminase